MIVGMVQQEDNCSWQDACNSWVEQDEEVAAGVYQVSACQDAVKQSAVGQCKKASIVEVDEIASEPDGLLLEGEEQEYFLELLMRRASPERPKASQPTENRDNSKGEAATAKGKGKRKNRKKERKALGRNTAEKEAGRREKKKGATGPASGSEEQPAPDLVNNPEAKGRGLVDGGREKKVQVTGPQATSGGECSRQKTPDYS
jgi:hypothetical protein